MALSPLPQCPVIGPGAVTPGPAGGHRRGGPGCPAGPALHAALQPWSFTRPRSLPLCKCGSLLRLQISESSPSARKPSLSPGPGQSLVLWTHRLWVPAFIALLFMYGCISPAWASAPDCLLSWAVNLTRRGRAALTHPFLSFPYTSSIQHGGWCFWPAG